MIAFTHGGHRTILEGGEFWAANPGGSLYRDAAAEEVWTTIRDIEAGTPWRDAVSGRFAQANPWLHRIVTDPSRDLFFRQHPPAPGAKILDLGAGWGQIAIPLAHHGEVVALEPTPERIAFIRAAASQEQVANRMYFVQGDFFEIELETRFDLVCCIGVLEWVPKFRPGEPLALQREFLERAARVLAPGGQIVIGIENRVGLKYLLGAPDDHLGVPGVAVHDRTLAARKWKTLAGNELRSFTFTQVELTELLAAAGLPNLTFFAALPDYKVPQLILPLGTEVDDYFTHGGFVPEHDGSRGGSLNFQPELQSLYQSLARMKVAHAFVPSFYAVAMRR
jgi:SAM-dependent methyltransferase